MMQRGNKLVEGNGWRVLGIAIIIGLIAAVLSGFAGLPFQIAASAADSRPIALVGRILSDGCSLSFGALAGTLLYFDLRARHVGAAALKRRRRRHQRGRIGSSRPAPSLAAHASPSPTARP